MNWIFGIGLSCLAALNIATATPLVERSGSDLHKRCTYGADARDCWGDYDLSTDYYNEVPDTGVTREYWLELRNITAAPDGVERMVLSVNGTVPGPTLYADWGDNVVIHVTNSLQNNGTGVHWHGIRQNYTNPMDGVPSITQCPIAPGSSHTYRWRATQYGSTWYHSHFGLQAWEGVLGGIIINGPSTANYDEDLGMMFLNDWSHQTVDEQYMAAQLTGPPKQDNGLINGTNTYNTGGSRWSGTFTAGKRYRIRLVNAAVESHWKFTIDGHNMTVMANDLVPIVPFTTEILRIGMGQRYDIIVTASGDADTNYWLRAVPQTTCSENRNAADIRGIIRYSSASTTEDPTTSAYDAMSDDDCDDMDMSLLVPYLSKSVTLSSGETEDDDLAITNNKVNGLFKWYIGGTTMAVEWADPTLLQVWNNETTWESQSGVIELDTADEWVYFVIETAQGIPHPIHLHGHDFFILAQGTGTYSSSDVTLQTDNPPRRDTAMLPLSGYLVIAFQTDNPGAWLMHCHIGFHTSEGFALQFVERKDEISALLEPTYDNFNETCADWTAYATADDIVADDSGV
ncbi:multicopper oxidase-like protein [Geopyxis carbonaria]|nr:multicopper oxidase-like protein [Geopyxis carbonaria]